MILALAMGLLCSSFKYKVIKQGFLALDEDSFKGSFEILLKTCIVVEDSLF